MYNRRNGDGLVKTPGRVCQCSCFCRDEITAKRINLCNPCCFNMHRGEDGKPFRRPETP